MSDSILKILIIDFEGMVLWLSYWELDENIDTTLSAP